jgi:hypothetical protein
MAQIKIDIFVDLQIAIVDTLNKDDVCSDLFEVLESQPRNIMPDSTETWGFDLTELPAAWADSDTNAQVDDNTTNEETYLIPFSLSIVGSVQTCYDDAIDEIQNLVGQTTRVFRKQKDSANDMAGNGGIVQSVTSDYMAHQIGDGRFVSFATIKGNYMNVYRYY